MTVATHPEGPQEHKPLWSTLQCGQSTAPLLPGWQHLGPSGVSLVFLLLSLHHFSFSSFPECRKRTSQEVSLSNCLLCNTSDFSRLPGFLLYTKYTQKHRNFELTLSNLETFRKNLICHLEGKAEIRNFAGSRFPNGMRKGSLHQL